MLGNRRNQWPKIKLILNRDNSSPIIPVLKPAKPDFVHILSLLLYINMIQLTMEVVLQCSIGLYIHAIFLVYVSIMPVRPI